jgi:hypothetical protein
MQTKTIPQSNHTLCEWAVSWEQELKIVKTFWYMEHYSENKYLLRFQHNDMLLFVFDNVAIFDY